MLAAGFELMVIGMGTVFAFLGLLVALMHVSARVIAALEPAPAARPIEPPDDEAEIAVVLAAVAAARQRARRAVPGRS